MLRFEPSFRRGYRFSVDIVVTLAVVAEWD